jgi:hypothetical protein
MVEKVIKKNLQRNEITQKKQKSEKYNELPEILKKKKNFYELLSYKLKKWYKNNLKLTVQNSKIIVRFSRTSLRLSFRYSRILL